MPDDISAPNDTRRARLVALRHDIHAHPELAFEEHRTSRLVAARLTELGLEVHTGLGGTGVVGTLRCGDGPGIGLRADMDALPIDEAGDAAHKSTCPGVMHACGHDGHTTMLLGAAEALVAREDIIGTVHFIFQPAEETSGGGRVMVEEGLFEIFPCNAVFAMHNWPGLKAGDIAVQPGPMMASVDTFTIALNGYGGHAAMPEKARDPITASAELILALQTIVSRKLNPQDPAVVSVTAIKGGEAFNVIPDSVHIKGTVRCFSPDVREKIKAEIETIAHAIGTAHGIDAVFQFIEGYPSTINTPREAAFAAKIASALTSDAQVQTQFRPSMASEDFSFMLQQVPGAYIWLGAGETAAPLHNPHFDFNDDLLLTGADLLTELAVNFLRDYPDI